jgi:hypothetical protein
MKQRSVSLRKALTDPKLLGNALAGNSFGMADAADRRCR